MRSVPWSDEHPHGRAPGPTGEQAGGKPVGRARGRAGRARQPDPAAGAGPDDGHRLGGGPRRALPRPYRHRSEAQQERCLRPLRLQGGASARDDPRGRRGLRRACRTAHAHCHRAPPAYGRCAAKTPSRCCTATAWRTRGQDGAFCVGCARRRPIRARCRISRGSAVRAPDRCRCQSRADPGRGPATGPPGAPRHRSAVRRRSRGRRTSAPRLLRSGRAPGATAG